MPRVISATTAYRNRIERSAVSRMRAAGQAVFCVSPGQRLRDHYVIYHRAPFAAWPCCHAWNLIPASRQINNKTSNHLITQAALKRASETITDWREGAFLAVDADSKSRLFLESGQTLPLLIECPAPADIIEAMKVHRIVWRKIKSCGHGSQHCQQGQVRGS